MMNLKQKFEIEADSATDLAIAKAALIASLGGGTDSGGGADGGGDPSTIGDNSLDPKDWSDAKIQAKFFDADVALALYPSPEGSQIIVETDGTYHPANIKFLKSYQGGIWKFDRDASGNLIPKTYEYGNGFQVSCNGSPFGYPVVGMVVAQGQVYLNCAGGFLQRVKVPDNVTAGVYNATLPVLWVPAVWGYEDLHGLNGSQPGGGSGGGGSPGGGTGGVQMPPDPPAPQIVPGSSGRVIQVGSATPFQYTTFATAIGAAQIGDTVKWGDQAPRGFVSTESFSVPEGILVDGGGRWNVPLAQVKQAIMDGLKAGLSPADLEVALDKLYTPGVILDGDSGPALAHGGLGMIVVEGNAIIDGFRIKNVGMHEQSHGGTAAIRHWDGAVGQQQGNDLFISNCQDGIGPGGQANQNNIYQVLAGPWNRTVLLQCGLPDGSGGSHNVYDLAIRSIIGTSFYSVVLPFKAGDGGHAYKARSFGVTFLSDDFLFVGSDSSAFDIPDGTAQPVQVTGGYIGQIAGALNHTLIGYGAESQNNGKAGVVARCTFGALCDSPNILTSGPVDITAATIVGNPIHGEGGGTVTGATASA